MECYVHNVPGRLRVRNPRFKEAGTHDAVRKSLVANIGHGLGTAEFSTTTGSLLIHYNPAEVNAKDILSVLHNAGYYDPARMVTNDQLFKSATSKAMRLVTKSVSGAFVETALQGTGLSFLAVLL